MDPVVKLVLFIRTNF